MKIHRVINYIVSMAKIAVRGKLSRVKINVNKRVTYPPKSGRWIEFFDNDIHIALKIVVL